MVIINNLYIWTQIGCLLFFHKHMNSIYFLNTIMCTILLLKYRYISMYSMCQYIPVVQCSIIWMNTHINTMDSYLAKVVDLIFRLLYFIPFLCVCSWVTMGSQEELYICVCEWVKGWINGKQIENELVNYLLLTNLIIIIIITMIMIIITAALR